MAAFPRHPFLRVIAVLWLLAAIVMLVVTLLRPEIGPNERSALSSLVPLYFLSLPAGHLGVTALNELKVKRYVESRYVASVFSDGLALWAALTLLGYVQWFVLLPWLARRLADFLCNRFLAR